MEESKDSPDQKSEDFSFSYARRKRRQYFRRPTTLRNVSKRFLQRLNPQMCIWDDGSLYALQIGGL
jgi:hypothetical protein